jgi:predicted restriction endonuclease
MTKTERRNWTEQELLVAMNLYCKLPFGQFNHKQPDIVRVAKAIGRTPSALSMKLCNLASLDQAHQERGVKGLANASSGDRKIWNAFQADWQAKALESEAAMRELLLADLNSTEEEEPADYSAETVKAEIEQRRGQQFFRRAVLVSYDHRCCITGNPVERLLTASHILPWAKSKKDRLNPANGLCLAKTQDAAFDAGLITLDEDFRLVLSSSLKDACTIQTIEENFLQYAGKPITLPSRFRPIEEFLSYHREKVFVA